MIKDRVKDIFNLFMPGLEYKHCVLLDNPENIYTQYFIPVLEVLDMQEGYVSGKHIFRLANQKEIVVVASLDVVEAILRRSVNGVRLIPIESK